MNCKVYGCDGQTVTKRVPLHLAIAAIKRHEAVLHNEGIMYLYSGTELSPSVMKAKIIKRDNHICYLCGKHVGNNGTVDHVMARAKTGPFKEYNLKCCCSNCNKDKKHKNLNKYIEHMVINRSLYPWLTDEKMKELYQLWSDVKAAFKEDQVVIHQNIETLRNNNRKG